MELGKGKLLRTGLNALYQAIHPVHGIAWTDGKQVILTALHLHNGEPKFGDSRVIGQFEHVHGLYWGPCATDTTTLLAVQHKKHITIWQLSYNLSERNKLLVSQICETGEPFPVLPQGCVWHPKKEILAVLTTRDASVLHTVRLNNSRIKADIKGSGLIHCACWTKEGNRLVIAIGSALHSYIWDDAQKTLNACFFCPIFDVGGYICAVEATLDSQVAVATELPLDKICGLNSGIAFEVPAGGETNSFPSQSTLVCGDEEFSMDVRKKSLDSEKSVPIVSVPSPSTVPVDLTHILSSKQRPCSSPLIHLRHKDYLTGSGQDSSHLILVTFERKVTTTRKVSIPGILVPDIMAFDHKTRTVSVASNTCNIILVYSLTSSCLPNIQQIQLEKSERPKGLCFLTEKLLLILVGKQKFTDPAFLPSSKSDKYVIRLMIKEILFEESSSAAAGTSGNSSLNAFLNIPVKKVSPENLSVEVHPLSNGLLIPSHPIQSPVNRKKLIEEIKSPTYEQHLLSCVRDITERKISMDSPSALETLDVEPTNRSLALHGLRTPAAFSNRPASPKRQVDVDPEISNAPKNNILLSEKEARYLSQNMERLCDSFTEVQHHLSELTELLKSRKTFLSVYPSSQEPSFINIIYQKQLSEPGEDKRRAVILCNGKLRLSVVQQIFSLSLIEMQHGSTWIVLTADSEGFVPLIFGSMQEIIIRDANSKGYSTHSSKTLDIISSTEGYRPMSSESLDITSSLEVLREHSSKSLDTSSSSEQSTSKT
ncbi:WD repeat and coiled-coil-containing protein-like [Pelodiscus sinensis]|uniref:WD repeat and coiled-coil-containing protein n=1 Tax=Pelodiscus sinensis TaxID=13735 RepID=K7GEZ4_PELSI|nr:WD repeat and coiled-coil-containing protein-like [Pelodiscus sinensis]XP_025038130.1 WD repeat and coiled-coil-containing protein-like [Pelodiscus sinensis]XP_025038131.1 WD repeat and coiled-coil-containing protein-like [Pelodiscus sinensis]XP_025038132.1 WD repeat and coiled-coil-containing protein-like [Pelodiscus sinensis]XP_025038133.1 WD repeat and coiled-coil-containing protein-like [Pelodiscus sinensis]XP_025038134.1 WD repeat and coiled-coil-containing protein-like [Pelodiscus sin|eukprot:XP_006118595.1 WD repeat and coiled-coil-containing protein-like [Pelodiscus sinensis]